MALFDYDWFCGPAFEHQKQQARIRCARKKHADVKPEDLDGNPEYQKFLSELEVRTLIYLRDGFSYEMKEMVDLGLKNMLSFECEPMDDQYKVGSFIVSILFEEVVRVEVFAVHPDEKPDDMPVITGFRNSPGEAMPSRDELREPREPRSDASESAESC